MAAREGPEEGTAAGILAVSNPHCSHEKMLAARSLKFLLLFPSRSSTFLFRPTAFIGLHFI